MKQWILRSFHLLNVEESEERFSDHDQDSDGSVSWKEYMMEVSVVRVECCRVQVEKILDYQFRSLILIRRKIR